MSWADALHLALRSSSRHPARTVLTMLGVALASGLLVALAALTSAVDTRVLDRFGQGGPLSMIRVVAASPQLDQLESDSAQTAGARDLAAVDLRTMRRIPMVTAAVPILAVPVFSVTPGGQGATTGMIGTDLAAAQYLPVNLIRGRLPTPGSISEATVTPDYLARLNIPVSKARSVLGSQILFESFQFQTDSSAPPLGRWFKMKVVGVVSQSLATGQFIVPVQAAQAVRAWQLAGSPNRNHPLPTSPYSGAIVVTATLDDLHGVREEITLLGFATSAPEHMISSIQKYLGIINLVLGAIGGLSLVIALLSVGNALLAAIHERRREIGVLKAIGARDSDVLRCFLIEAFGIGLVGGLAGALGGILISEMVGLVVNHYLANEGLKSIDLVGVPVGIAVLGWIASAVLAVAAGAIPSLRAAHLPARAAVVEG